MADDPIPVEVPPIVDKTLIKPIELDDAQGRWVFEPKPDITGLESILIAHMFSAITVRYLKGDQSRFDWREYLTRDRLRSCNTGADSNTDAIAPPDLVRHFRVLE